MIDLDTIFEPEDLHPDLADHLHEADGWKVLRHPLVYSVPHFDAANRHCNLVYAQKLANIERAKAERDWSAVLAMYEVPYRLDALVDLAEAITEPRDYWGHVRDIWSRTELPNLQFEKWLAVWTAADSPSLVPHRKAAMTRTEIKHFASLPPVIEVWRGAGREEWAADGLSWCLDRGTAEWFAWRYRDGRITPSCARGTIARADVFALLLDRNEWEIVAEPDCVTVQEIYDAPRTIKKPDPLWKFAKSGTNS